MSNHTMSRQAPYLCPHPPLRTPLPSHRPHTHVHQASEAHRAPDLQAPDGDSTKQGAEGRGPAPPPAEPSPPPLVCRALAPPGEQGWD